MENAMELQCDDIRLPLLLLLRYTLSLASAAAGRVKTASQLCASVKKHAADTGQRARPQCDEPELSLPLSFKVLCCLL